MHHRTTLAALSSAALGLGLASPAHAVEFELGVGAGVGIDFNDKASDTSFGAGPSLELPFRVHFNDVFKLRFTLRGAANFGHDSVSWTEHVDGQPILVQSTDHWAMLTHFAFTGGVDVFIPGDLPITPYFGAEVGGAWMATYHSFDDSASALLDPNQNKLDSSGNLDPWAAQLALYTDVHFGLHRDLSDAVALWFETGYSLSFLGARPLKKTPPELDAQRDAFSYNALRFGLGLSFTL